MYAHIRNMPGMPPIRAKKLAMADARALEEQAERDADTKGMPQKPLPLAGGAKKILSGMTRKSAPAEEPHEAEGYGRMLMEHIHKLHGGAYGAAFMKGMSAYGNPDVAATAVSFDSNVPQKAADKPKLLKGKGHVIGAGKMKLEACEESSSDEEMEGGLLSGKLQGEGKVDHRKARAAVVRQVMHEKGMKMAEASKFVKEHGLWKRE